VSAAPEPRPGPMNPRVLEAEALAKQQVRDAGATPGDLALSCDVVVVGSGAGGAVVAATLAEAGQRVIVLEEGGYFPQSEAGAMRPSQQLRHLWRDAGMTFAIGVGDSPVINVMMGKCVGGSSALTGGVCFRTPDHVLQTWQRERGLSDFTPGHLEPYFEAVEKRVHVETVTPDRWSSSTLAFARGTAKLGHPLKPMRRNTEGCQGYSRCNFTCPVGAKLSVDVSFLPSAFRAGAELYAHCMVDRVTHRDGRATGVVGRVLNGPRHAPGGRLEVKARRVVIAAGAYHTPLILQASGVGRASEQVGRNMTLHPGFRVMARFEERLDGWRGALQGAWSDALEHERITMTALFLPPGVLAATLPGIGRAHRLNAELIPYLGVFGGMLHDEGGGTVRRGPGREPLVTYRMDPRDKAALPTLMRWMAKAWFAAGAKEVILPVLGMAPVTADQLDTLDLEHVPGQMLESSSQHPLGTCRMAHSAEAGVLDSDGQAWDLQELFVADGSIVPTSLGVNPQLTIMALALRIAERLRERPLPE